MTQLMCNDPLRRSCLVAMVMKFGKGNKVSVFGAMVTKMFTYIMTSQSGFLPTHGLNFYIPVTPRSLD